MRFNAKELGRSSLSWQLDMEGVLLLREKKSEKLFKSSGYTLTTHWCRLRGNLLIICRTSESNCSEVHSLLFLEDHFVDDQLPSKEYPTGFTITFPRTDDTSIVLVAQSDQEKINWVRAISRAGIQPIRHRIQKLRIEIEKYHMMANEPHSSSQSSTVDSGSIVLRSKETLMFNNHSGGNSEEADHRAGRAFSIGDEFLGNLSIDTLEGEQGGLEFTLSCRQLPSVTSEIMPNSCVIMFIRTPPTNVGRAVGHRKSKESITADKDLHWIQIGRSEIFENSVNPDYSKTIFLPTQQYTHTSVVRFKVVDVKEVKSCITQCVGMADVDIQVLQNNSSHTMKLQSFGEEQRLGTLTVHVAHRLPILNKGSTQYDLPTMQFRSIAVNVVNKNFSFSQTLSDQPMKVVEFMGESIFGYEIPLQFLKYLIQSEHLLHDSLIRSSTNSAFMEMCRSDLIMAMKDQIAFYENSLRMLSEFGTSPFKRSKDKASPHVEFLPTNLHVNRLAVMDYKNSIMANNDIISVGVFAAFCRGLSHGGLNRLASSHPESCDPDHPAALALHLLRTGCQLAQDMHCELTNITQQLIPLLGTSDLFLAPTFSAENRFGFKRFYSLIQKLKRLTKDPLLSSRADFTALEEAFIKAQEHLKEMVLSSENVEKMSEKEVKYSQSTFDRFMKRLLLSTEQLWQDSLARDVLWPRVLAIITRCQQPLVAPKVTAQSKNTTHDHTNNSGNISSLMNSSPNVNLSADVFTAFHIRANVCISQALCAVITGIANNLLWLEEDWVQMSLCGVPLSFESLVSTYLNEAAMLEDMFWTVRYLQSVRIVIKPATASAIKPRATVINLFKCELSCPSVIWANAPENIQSQGQVTLRLHPFMFNVGINEVQTLAETINATDLQKTINLWGLDQLKQYFDRYIKHFGCPKKTLDNMDVCDSLDTLRDAINSKQSKPVHILRIMERVSYSLRAIRFTSCKSAKDRTSMAMTLEWIRWLKDGMGLQPEYFDDALKCIRSTGLRLENAYKNVGIKKFAFGAVQLLSFPKLYKPPAGTYGAAPS